MCCNRARSMVICYEMLACHRCQRPFAATEPVYRWHVPRTARYSYPNVCEACAKEVRSTWRKNWKNCLVCGRQIYISSTRHLTVCSEDCARARQTKRAKELRLARRIKVYRCRVCGAEFEAARSDASFCSVKCRVSSYRRRRRKVNIEPA
jgi:predicted nucleic acid-binding Zn ribbon protein